MSIISQESAPTALPVGKTADSAGDGRRVRPSTFARLAATVRALRFGLLLGILLGGAAMAQEAAMPPTPSAPPDFVTLQQNWWSYFEGAAAEIEPKVGSFLNTVAVQLADLSPQNQASATSVLEAVRDNFEVYLSLLDGGEPAHSELPDPAVSYSIEELLTIAATAREARALARAAELEVEREQRTLDGASRRRDVVFKEYLSAAAHDERWLSALRVVRARSALEISRRRLELLSRNHDAAAAFAANATARVELARGRLAGDLDEGAIATLDTDVDAKALEVTHAEERHREAQLAASNLELDTARGRSEQRLQGQRLLDADIRLAQSRIALALIEARRWWAELDRNERSSLDAVTDAVLAWSEILRDVRERIPQWKRETEDELLAVQSMDRDGLDRASRRLLDQRLGTAQSTLARLAELDAETADLDLLILVIDGAVAERSGPFQSWLSNSSRLAKTTWIRVTDLTELTLFSVGDTPVTAGDIVRVLIILLIASLLSRGLHRAFNRVGDRQSVGSQASLYTISRLLHYTIIIVAVFIALTSIGLNLGSLALVAGALSVGIGFGLQSIVNNFVSGLIILFERTLRVGDYIELDNGLTGTVKAINVRSTMINTNDNIDIVVPNSEFVTTRLTNWTLGEHILRVRIPFGVAYGSDKELVRKAAIEATEEVPYTLTHMPGREPDVWLVEYGDNSLNFLLLVWVNRLGARRPTRTRAAYLWALETKLRKYGIDIPFPQRDLHLRSGWPNILEIAAGRHTVGEPETVVGPAFIAEKTDNPAPRPDLAPAAGE